MGDVSEKEREIGNKEGGTRGTHLRVQNMETRGCTVTAATLEDEEERQKCLDALDAQVRELVLSFPVVFAPPDRLPPPREVQHVIRLLPDVNPVKRAPYLARQ